MTDNYVTICGNLTQEPELRFTPSGAAVCNLTVAHTPRKFDRSANEWVDAGETLFLRGSVWRDQAENAAESLKVGDRVIVTGQLTSRSWEDKEGNKRISVEMAIDEVAASLKHRSVKVQPKSDVNQYG